MLSADEAPPFEVPAVGVAIEDGLAEQRPIPVDLPGAVDLAGGVILVDQVDHMGSNRPDREPQWLEAASKRLGERLSTRPEAADLDVGDEQIDEAVEIPGVDSEGIASHQLADRLERLEAIDPALEVHRLIVGATDPSCREAVDGTDWLR